MLAVVRVVQCQCPSQNVPRNFSLLSGTWSTGPPRASLRLLNNLSFSSPAADGRAEPTALVGEAGKSGTVSFYFRTRLIPREFPLPEPRGIGKFPTG